MDNALAQVAAGQRLVIQGITATVAALVLNIVARFAHSPALGSLGAVVGLIALTLAIVGFLRLGEGFGYSLVLRIVLVMLAILPVVSLITLLVLNARATKMLRAAGIPVGFFGSRKV